MDQESHLHRAARLLSVLANPTRLRIIHSLGQQGALRLIELEN
jgi:DNA-binding transcriptional ArsR family regulator